MPYEYAGLTDVGRKREHNEDALLLAPESRLFAVCDGMGGHQAGEVASGIAVETLERFFQNVTADEEATWPYRLDPRFDEYGNRLVVGIQYANQRIREAGLEEGKQGMGTTAVAAHLNGSRAYFGWVGDSRGYLLRRGELRPTTTDHSLLNELLRSGRIREEDLENFQHKNVITRALGMGDHVEVDVNSVDLVDGDVLVVCCDGLTGMLEDQRIAEIVLREKSLDKACQKLIDAANAAGGLDNITVALVRYRA